MRVIPCNPYCPVILQLGIQATDSFATVEESSLELPKLNETGKIGQEIADCVE
jgi:hypothetical protein